MGKKDKTTQDAVVRARRRRPPPRAPRASWDRSTCNRRSSASRASAATRCETSMSSWTGSPTPCRRWRRRTSASARGRRPSIVGTPDLDDVSRQADEIIERARTEAARIVAEAKANGAQPTKEQGAAASPQERAAVNAFLTKEREFLQSLAGLVQGHAESVKRHVEDRQACPGAHGYPTCRAPGPRDGSGTHRRARRKRRPPPPAPAAGRPRPASPTLGHGGGRADAPKPRPAEDRPAATTSPRSGSRIPSPHAVWPALEAEGDCARRESRSFAARPVLGR